MEFGKRRYCYTFTNCCLEDKELKLCDGSISIFLSTKGENEAEVSQELIKFLKFVSADLNESISDFQDPYVQQLQKTIRRIKSSREMEERYMILTELLRDEYADGRAEGKAESVLDLLSELGEIPSGLRDTIMSQKDTIILQKWLKLAAKAESIIQFQEQM